MTETPTSGQKPSPVLCTTELRRNAHVLVLQEMRTRLTDAGSPSRTAALDAAISALSAQPSPGGQGNDLAVELLATELERDGNDQAAIAIRSGNTTYGMKLLHAALRAITAALAARQPVEGIPGQPTRTYSLDVLGNPMRKDKNGVYESAEWPSDRQPVGEPVAFQLAGSEPLWCLHVLGMDDVHPAPSKAHAEKAAAWHNEQFKDQAERLGISIEAKVVPWPHSAESHAAGVAEFIPQWLIPQWQLDALEANAAQPAQAVDLGQLPRYSKSYSEGIYLDGAGDWVRFADVLALIDSLAVGK
ncbi:TPA: hypothetical protein QEF96_000828 [Stenotrophomonas maltophilia]|nr:hypothetical protein [Stenotrophomonas maltophilia]